MVLIYRWTLEVFHEQIITTSRWHDFRTFIIVNMSDQILQRTVLKDYGETKVAMAAHAVDLELGNVFTYTLSGGQTVTFTNPPASGTAGSFTMIVTNGGSATLTWPTSVD